MTHLRNDYLGGQPTDVTRTTPSHPLGFRIRTQDTAYGDGEFVYIQASAAYTAGQAVVTNFNNGTTALATTRSRGPLGITTTAMAVNTYGWLQTRGAVPCLVSGTVAAGANLFTTATPGTLSTTPVTGDQVLGATSATANGTPAAGQAVITLNQPFLGDTDNA